MQSYSAAGRPVPLVTPVAQPFFDAARGGDLVMQHCPRDGFFFYPRAHCPSCLGTDWRWRPVLPRGRVRSITVDRVGQDPHQRMRVPLAILLVVLDEGPRMIGNIAAGEPAEFAIGDDVEVAFELVDGLPLTVFRRPADRPNPGTTKEQAHERL